MIDLKRSLLVTGFPYNIWKKNKRVIVLFKKFLTAAQGMRRLGSAALDLAWVASGRFDGFWEEGLNPWDTMAGFLIVEEAGGKMTDYRGRPYRMGSPTLVASNGKIHSALVRVTKG